MRTSITVTRHPTLPGVYQVSVSGGGARGGRVDVRGPGAAAALAIQKAHQFGSSGYHIFGPDEVTAQIPEDMRGKK